MTSDRIILFALNILVHYMENFNIDMIKGWNLLENGNLWWQWTEIGNFEKIGTEIENLTPLDPPHIKEAWYSLLRKIDGKYKNNYKLHCVSL